MQYIHYHNDFTVPISLVSDSIIVSPELIDSITFYTRKQGNSYCCCWDCKTLYKDEECVYAVLNNHNLEPGVLDYMVEYQIPDSNYPDGFQKVCQHYTSDIELTTQNGDITVAEALIIYGETIRELIESAGYSYTKEEVDDMIAQLDLDINTYSKAEIDLMIANVEVDAYTKSETDTLLSGKANSNSVYTKTESDNKYLTAQDISQLANKSEIPKKTSQLQNDSNFISDANYVHTDNNYSTTDKNKLAGLTNYDDTSLSNRVGTLENDIDEKADKDSTVSNVTYNVISRKISKTVNGNTSDVVTLHSVATSGNYSQLNNKPTIPSKTSDLTNDSDYVSDANYVHTDNNYTTAEKNKLSNLNGKQIVMIQVFDPNTQNVSFKDEDGNTVSDTELLAMFEDETKEVILCYYVNYLTCHTYLIEYEISENEKYYTFSSLYGNTTNSIESHTFMFYFEDDELMSCEYYDKRVQQAPTTNVGFGQGYAIQSNVSSATSNSASLAAYTLVEGGIVTVYFKNDVPQNATLNINGRGNKQMYYRNAQIGADVIKAGDTVTFMYHSSKYYLISNDRWGLTT